MVIKKIEVENG